MILAFLRTSVGYLMLSYLCPEGNLTLSIPGFPVSIAPDGFAVTFSAREETIIIHIPNDFSDAIWRFGDRCP